MNEAARANRLGISFNSRGETVDRTIERLPDENLNEFLQRCFEDVDGYYRHDWSNWYRLEGEIETDWLSEGSMFAFLEAELRGATDDDS